MELVLIWRLAQRRWWLIALPAAVALLLTLPTLKNMVAPAVTYSVQMQLTAAAPPDAEIEGVTTPYEDTSYVPLLASEYVVVNMPAWITSDTFAQEVSRELANQHGNISADDLDAAFAADSFRSILTLYVSWDDREEIRTIAQAAVTVLQTHNQDYFPQFAAAPVRVVALDDVKVSEVSPPITTRFTPLIRIVIGLAAGVGLAVLAEYLDASIRSPDDIEAIGLTVIATIPPEPK